MKKVAWFLVVLMAIATPGFSLMATVDRVVVEDRVESDLRPERDLGRMVKFVKDDLILKPIDFVTKPLDPVMKPVKKVGGEVLKAPVKLVNFTWDVITKPIPGYKK